MSCYPNTLLPSMVTKCHIEIIDKKILISRFYVSMKYVLTVWFLEESCLKHTSEWDFIHRQELQILEHTTFRKMDLPPCSGEGRNRGRHAYSVVSLRKS
jgi:hypothetical protein